VANCNRKFWSRNKALAAVNSHAKPVTVQPLEGVLVVDKPGGMTSHDVVDRLRRLTGMRRIGHTGTLDPFATGVLVLCFGRATKIARFLSALDKEYEGEMILGAVSSTYDVDGEIRAVAEGVGIDRGRIEQEMSKFVGEILQTPPPYSAVKVRGRKLYEYARAGEIIQAEPRRVRVYEFSIVPACADRSYDPARAPAPPVAGGKPACTGRPPKLSFRARVGSGTYVRSLCHDLGQALGCGAYVAALRRTRVGHFSLDDAVTLEQLEGMPASLRDHIITIVDAVPRRVGY
jgi:tRNA pseudouridine55 synthase